MLKYLRDLARYLDHGPFGWEWDIYARKHGAVIRATAFQGGARYSRSRSVPWRKMEEAATDPLPAELETLVTELREELANA